MKKILIIVFAVFLILALLIQVGIIAYGDDVFSVSDVLLNKASKVSNFGESIFRFVFGNDTSDFYITFFLVDSQRHYMISDCSNNQISKNYQVFSSSFLDVSYFRQNFLGQWKLLDSDLNVLFSFSKLKALFYKNPTINVADLSLAFYPLDSYSQGLNYASDWVDHGVLPPDYN